MASVNVQFYEKVKELQEIQHKSEEERWKLEQQLNGFVRSDKRLAKLKAARLQSYWKKICEDEKKAALRNEQLLKDFHRIETQLNSLSTKTEKLRLLKKQYEDHIDRMYPRWKEAQLLWQREQQNEPDKLLSRASHTSKPASALEQTQGIPLQNHQLSPQGIPGEASAQPQYVNDFHSQGYTQGGGISGKFTAVNHEVKSADLSAGGELEGQSKARDLKSVAPAVSQMKPHSYADDEFLPQRNTPRDAAQKQQTPRVFETNVDTLSPLENEESETTSLKQPVINVNMVNVHSTPQKPVSVQADQISDRAPSENFGSGDFETWNSTKSATPRPTASLTGEKIREESQEVARNPLRGSTDDVSDIETDVSLPLTDNNSPMKVKVTVTSQQSDPTVSHLQQRTGFRENLHLKKTQSLPVKQEDRPSTPTTPGFGGIKPDISRKGFYILLRVVQEDFPISMSKQDFYRTQMPAYSVKNEIIHNADSGGSLVHLNPSSISMVVLDQLALMARNNREGCLLTDSLLSSDLQLNTETAIRSQIDMSSQGLWEKLVEHLKQIVKYRVMPPDVAASTFAPHLIKEDSPYVEKAARLLASFLQSFIDETVFSDTSSVTIPSPPVSPTRKVVHDVNQSQVPPLDLPDSLKTKTEADDDDDDFFAQDIPKDDVTVPLTQTAAYRSLLTGTQTTTTATVEEADSDLDDVENQVGSMLSPASRSNIASPQHMKGAKKGSKEEILSGDDRSSVSSPVHSPAYVPTSMDRSGKMGTSLGGTFQSKVSTGKKPAFLRTDSDFDTDTEAEIAIANVIAGSKKIEEEKDDFDFYD